MFRKYLLAFGAALLLTAIPASAQPRGGGGGGGGRPGGTQHASPGHMGASNAGPGQRGGYSGYSNGGYRGLSTGGIALSFGLGLANNLLGGGYGGYGGSNYYRPSYYGNGSSSGGYYGNGYSGGGYYGNQIVPTYGAPAYPSPSVVTLPQTGYTYPNVVNSPALNPTITAPPAATIPLGAETGLKITDLYEGTAKVAGLRKGDIILKVDGTRTQSFEELRATLSTGKDRVVVEYIDGTSGETDRRTVLLDGTKIGVSVAETTVAK